MAQSNHLAIVEAAEPEEPTSAAIAVFSGLEPGEIADFQELTRGEIEHYDRPLQNPAVYRCYCAWSHALKKEQAKLAANKDAEDKVRSVSKSAYLRNMPPLDSLRNVRDFIACVTYAEVTGLIAHYEAVDLLDSAKVALAAVRHEQRPGTTEPKRLGRPPKSAPANKINKRKNLSPIPR
jgi:hypothetical protein